MKLSRRHFVRLGALSASAVSSSSFARTLLAPAGTGPAPDSVLVLVEGPWNYTQPVTGTIRCASLPDPHICQMGLWDAATSSLVSPYDTSKPGPNLPNGATLNASLKSANARPDVVKVFDAAFYRDDIGGADNFPYLRNTGLKVVPQSTDRTVLVPVPDNVYVAGRVLNGKLHDGSASPQIVNPDTARIYVTYVFEYTQDASASTSLTVTDAAGNTFTLTKGQHLIFQMQPAVSTASDVPHITAAFTGLVSRIGDGKLPLSVQFPEQVTVADIQRGINVQGLSDAELGLHVSTIAGHARKKSEADHQHYLKLDKTPACAGGGIPTFP